MTHAMRGTLVFAALILTGCTRSVEGGSAVADVVASVLEPGPPKPAPAGTPVPEDLSTDEGVRLAMNRVSGGTCERVSNCLCIRRSDALPGVVVTGSFAYDRGCRAAGVFAGGAWYPEATKATAPLLAAQGWATADAARREALAHDVVDGVLLVWDGGLIHSVPSDAPASVTPPVVTSTPDGGVTVEASYEARRTSNRKPSAPLEPNYQRAGYRFGPDGALVPLN